jgi:hypothetical protein
MPLIDSVGQHVVAKQAQENMGELQGEAFFIILKVFFCHYSISGQNSIQAFERCRLSSGKLERMDCLNQVEALGEHRQVVHSSTSILSSRL